MAAITFRFIKAPCAMLCLLAGCTLPKLDIKAPALRATQMHAASAAAAADGGKAPASASTDQTEPGELAGTGARFAQPSGRASGARVRVVNAYLPLDGEPGPVDIFPHAWATDGDEPLLSVPYGEVSAYFDPTVADDNGDMFLSFYWKGTRGDGNALISKTETLKAGDTITYLLVSSDQTQPSGRRFAALQTFFHGASVLPFGADVPQDGKSLLVVTSVGIDQVVPSPADVSYFFSLGDGCTKAVDDDDFSLTAVGPGTSGVYTLDPGSYSASIHQNGHDPNALPSCDNESMIESVDFTAIADQSAVLFLYASGPDEFHTKFLALDR